MYPNIYRTGSTTFLGLKFNRDDVDEYDSPISAPPVPPTPHLKYVEESPFWIWKKKSVKFWF